MPTDTNQTPAEGASTHQPPTVTRLGTLAELTQGGVFGVPDGLGDAGDQGSLPG